MINRPNNGKLGPILHLLAFSVASVSCKLKKHDQKESEQNLNLQHFWFPVEF